MALVTFPPHKFVCPSCGYYGLQETKNFAVGASFNGIRSIIHFEKIESFVEKLKGGNTDSIMRLF